MSKDLKSISFESAQKYGWGLILLHPDTLRQFLKGLFEKKGHLDILEIGCWKGQLVGWLHQNFPKGKYSWNYWGVDIVEPPDRRKDYPHLIMNAEALEFPAENFDVVIMLEVLEHVVEYPKALREVFRVLRPGGGVYIETVMCSDPNALLDEQHFHVLHPVTLTRLMKWLGFKDCQYRTNGVFSLWCYK